MYNNVFISLLFDVCWPPAGQLAKLERNRLVCLFSDNQRSCRELLWEEMPYMDDQHSPKVLLKRQRLNATLSRGV